MSYPNYKDAQLPSHLNCLDNRWNYCFASLQANRPILVQEIFLQKATIPMTRKRDRERNN